jgi:plasmid stabilization system protein ParE
MDTVSKIGNGKAAKRRQDAWDDVYGLVEARREHLMFRDEARKAAERERACLERLGQLVPNEGDRRILSTGAYSDAVIVYRRDGLPVVDVVRIESAVVALYPEPDDDFDDDTRIGLTALGWATAIPPTANAATE